MNNVVQMKNVQNVNTKANLKYVEYVISFQNTKLTLIE